jgi:hypothetical protein
MQEQTRTMNSKALVTAVRTTAIAALTAGLLAGSALGVAAQTDELGADWPPELRTSFGLLSSGDAIAAVESTGAAPDFSIETPLYYTWSTGEGTSFGEGTFDEAAGELRGMTSGGIPITASDPRFSGIADVVINGNVERNGDERGFVESRSYRIVDNLGCTWTGTGTYFMLVTADEVPTVERESFVGAGAGPCAGMTLLATGDYREGSQGEALIIRNPTPPVPVVPDAALAIVE